MMGCCEEVFEPTDAFCSWLRGRRLPFPFGLRAKGNEQATVKESVVPFFCFWQVGGEIKVWGFSDVFGHVVCG